MIDRVDTTGARRVADNLYGWAVRRSDDEAFRIYMRGLRDQLEGYIEAMEEYMEEAEGEHRHGEPA